MTIDADDIFEKSLRHRTERIQEENDRGDFTRRPQMVGVAAAPGKPAVVRIAGFPMESRMRPTDARAVLNSQILTDKEDAYIKVYWPMEILQTVMWKDPKTGIEIPVHSYDIDRVDKDYVLHRFYEDVTHGEWEEVEEGKGMFGAKKHLNKIYTHAGNKTLLRVVSNIRKGAVPGKEKGRNFKYRKAIAMNCIDRGDGWCVENKHYKLLTSSANERERKGKKVVFIEPGLSAKAYNKIMENMVGNLGNWAMYDIILTRSSDDNDKDTTIACIRDSAIPPIARKIGKDGPMTAEELAYEGYNFDEEYQFTTATKLLKNCRKLFAEWDNYAGSTYINELEELAEVEKDQRKEKKAANPVAARSPQGTITKPTAAPDEDDDDVEEGDDHDDPDQALQRALALDDAQFTRQHTAAESAPAPAPAPTPAAAPVRRAPAKPAEPVVTLLPPTPENFRKYLPFWDKLNAIDHEELAMHVKGIRADGSLDYNPGVSAAECDNPDCMYPGTNERTVTPITMNNCPVCFHSYTGTPQ